MAVGNVGCCMDIYLICSPSRGVEGTWSQELPGPIIESYQKMKLLFLVEDTR